MIILRARMKPFLAKISVLLLLVAFNISAIQFNYSIHLCGSTVKNVSFFGKQAKKCKHKENLTHNKPALKACCAKKKKIAQVTKCSSSLKKKCCSTFFKKLELENQTLQKFEKRPALNPATSFIEFTKFKHVKKKYLLKKYPRPPDIALPKLEELQSYLI